MYGNRKYLYQERLNKKLKKNLEGIEDIYENIWGVFMELQRKY